MEGIDCDVYQAKRLPDSNMPNSFSLHVSNVVAGI